ncbi:hypothetical protein WA026_003100 [Henosepilachna vigintioctopunctata]|uniref:Neprilysin n=1 Tax=Henosepilachna vigintioctopunctata TaxID=420089 RepID=A0AAW1TM20_9CUCU
MPFNRARQENWWKRRTTLEKHLSCIALGMIFLAIILSICLIFYNQYGEPKGVCLTSSCVHAASEIMDRLNESVDPCEDFYSFACGGYIEKTRIPDDLQHINSFIEAGAKLVLQLGQF